MFSSSHNHFNTNRVLLLLSIGLILISLETIVIQKIHTPPRKQQIPKEKQIQTTGPIPGISYLGNGEIDTSDWFTYRNEEYGFEFRYPKEWEVREEKKWIGLFVKGSKPHESAFFYLNISDSLSDFWDYDGEKTLEKYILKRTGDYNQELFRFHDVKEIKVAEQEAIQYIDYNGYQGQNMLNFYWQYKGKIFSTSFALKYKDIPLKIIESFHYF